MPALEEPAFKKQIKEKQFQRVYLLYGEEPCLIEKYASLIIARVVGGGMEDFNLQKFDGKTPVNDIAEAVEALPLMAEKKCVLVSDFDAEAMNASEAKKMEELMNRLPESCVLIFRMTSVEVNVKKSAKWRNFVKWLEKAGASVALGRRDTGALVKYLTELASKRGCVFPAEEAKYLIRLAGVDLSTLTNETEKICAYAGEGTIRREQVDAVAVKTTETAAYKLANAIISGGYDQAYELLGVLFYQREDPVVILAALASAYVDLYRAKAAVESGVSISQAAQRFEYRSLEFKLRNAARDCGKLKLSQLRKCLDCIYQTDGELKGSRTDQRVVLEKLLAKLLMISVKG